MDSIYIVRTYRIPDTEYCLPYIYGITVCHCTNSHSELIYDLKSYCYSEFFRKYQSVFTLFYWHIISFIDISICSNMDERHIFRTYPGYNMVFFLSVESSNILSICGVNRYSMHNIPACIKQVWHIDIFKTLQDLNMTSSSIKACITPYFE